MRIRNATRGWVQDWAWHLLFLDALFLFLRFGGLSVLDWLVHTVFLTGAAFVFGLRRQFSSIESVFLWIFALPIGVGLVQLIPLPDAVFPLLAPIKSRILEAVHAIDPAISAPAVITMTPSFHLLKLGILVLDLLLVFMLLMVMPPRRETVRFWVLVVGITVGASAIWLPGGAVGGEAGWFGSLVNPNHYALTAVILLIWMCHYEVLWMQRLVRHWRGEWRLSVKDLHRNILGGSLGLFIAFLLLVGFTLAASRAGVVNLFLGFWLFLGLSFWRGNLKRVATFALPCAMLLLIAILVLPMGRNVNKFERLGLDPQMRIAALKVGVAYLAEVPLLGAGLGATESLLPAVAPQAPMVTVNLREFHNEYLQVAVEYGLLGAVALVWLLFEVVRRLWRLRGHAEFQDRQFIHAVLAMLGVVAAHSVVSFPLRVTAIRVLVLVLTGVALRLETVSDLRSRAGFLLIPLIVLGLLFWTRIYNRAYSEEVAGSSQIQMAREYGLFHRIPLFEANRRMDALLKAGVPAEALAREAQPMRALLYAHLQENPLSLKALNLLFVLEALENKAATPEFDRTGFEVLVLKAKRIQALGKNRNVHARMALLFLYALHEPHLDEEEAKVYETLKRPLAKRYREIQKSLTEPIEPPP